MAKPAAISFIGLLFAAICAFAPNTALAAPADSKTLSVEIDGSIPGFTQDQLTAYVAAQMSAADVASWHFAPAAAGTAEPPNRIVWHFKALPFAGGTIRYIGPALNRAREAFGVGRAIGIDAKIYLNGKYQASTFDQVTVKGGPNDANLNGAIQKVTRIIVSDALTEEMPGNLILVG